MKYILVLTLLILSPIATAVNINWTDSVVVYAGYTDPFNNWDSDNHKATFILALESAHKYPWVASYSYVPEHSIVDSYSSFAIGKQARYRFGNGWYVYGEFGGLVNTRKTEASSTYFNFYEIIGVAYKDVRIGLKHVSNAYTGHHNNGEEQLFVAYVF